MDWRKIYWQQRAEDIYLYHSYLYYVLHEPKMGDIEFDLMHKWLLNLWPSSPILRDFIGSDNPNDYPEYITQFRRPQHYERRSRQT
jgi:NAD-dependent DNA ligase